MAANERAPEQVQNPGLQGCAQGNVWPGQWAGVRPPMVDETPLSADEVRHGIVVGVLGAAGRDV